MAHRPSPLPSPLRIADLSTDEPLPTFLSPAADPNIPAIFRAALFSSLICLWDSRTSISFTSGTSLSQLQISHSIAFPHSARDCPIALSPEYSICFETFAIRIGSFQPSRWKAFDPIQNASVLPSHLPSSPWTALILDQDEKSLFSLPYRLQRADPRSNDSPIIARYCESALKSPGWVCQRSTEVRPFLSIFSIQGCMSGHRNFARPNRIIESSFPSRDILRFFTTQKGFHDRILKPVSLNLARFPAISEAKQHSGQHKSGWNKPGNGFNASISAGIKADSKIRQHF
jgi:hypothetical protein